MGEDNKVEQKFEPKVEPKKKSRKKFIERKMTAINKLQNPAKAKRLAEQLLRTK